MGLSFLDMGLLHSSCGRTPPCDLNGFSPCRRLGHLGLIRLLILHRVVRIVFTLVRGLGGPVGPILLTLFSLDVGGVQHAGMLTKDH